MPKIDFRQQTQINIPQYLVTKFLTAISYTKYSIRNPTAMRCSAMCHKDGRLHALRQFNRQ